MNGSLSEVKPLKCLLVAFGDISKQVENTVSLDKRDDKENSFTTK